MSEKKSIWKQDANEALDPLAHAYLRWLQKHWWAPVVMVVPTAVGVALWLFAR